MQKIYKFAISSTVHAKWDWNRKNPLPSILNRENGLDQMCLGFIHTSAAARWTKPPFFARKWQDFFMTTVITFQAGEPLSRIAARKIIFKFLQNIRRDIFPFFFHQSLEFAEVFSDDLMQYGIFRLSLIVCWIGGHMQDIESNIPHNEPRTRKVKSEMSLASSAQNVRM